jgi:hypothetical protein
MLKEVYYLIVSGAFDRKEIEFENFPTEEQIIEAIKEKQGNTARIEKRYKLIE